MTFNKKASDELQRLLSSDVMYGLMREVKREEQASVARKLRGEASPEWMTALIDTLGIDNKLINPATGQKHTVESMVEEYNKRIGLTHIIDNGRYAELSKSAKLKDDFPLSKKAIEQRAMQPEASWEEISDLISKEISSHRGNVDIPAVIYDIRDVYGDETVGYYGENILEEIARQRREFKDSHQEGSVSREEFDGKPIKDDGTPDEGDQLFQNMKAAL